MPEGYFREIKVTCLCQKAILERLKSPVCARRLFSLTGDCATCQVVVVAGLFSSNECLLLSETVNMLIINCYKNLSIKLNKLTPLMQ